MISFNLVNQPWVPCRFSDDSRPVLLGLKQTLLRAHEIREIESSSPIVTASLHRLLLVILHRHFKRGYGPISTEEWAALWERGCFDKTLVTDYLEKWQNRFDLFHREHPFFQCASLNPEYARPVCVLAPERASGHNATLFDHTIEEDANSITAVVAAHALLAVQLFAVGGLVSLEKGQDPKKYKSARGAPLVKAALTLIVGGSLFETLLLNLHRFDRSEHTPFRSGPQDQPAWERPRAPSAGERYPLGPFDYFTWQSRRVLLIPHAENDGQVRIARAVLMKGEELPQGWQQKDRETMVAFRKNATDKKLDSAPWTPVAFQPGRSVWRDSLSLFQSIASRQVRPLTLEWLGSLVGVGVLPSTSRYQVQLLGLSTDQARVLLWRHERMPLPLAYLREKALVEKLHWALDGAEKAAGALHVAAMRLARNLLSPETLNAETRREPDKNRLRELTRSISPEARYWSALDLEFRRFLVDLADDVSVDEDGHSIYGERVVTLWHRTVGEKARKAFMDVARELGDTLRVLKAVALVQDRYHASLRRVLDRSTRQ